MSHRKMKHKRGAHKRTSPLGVKGIKSDGTDYPVTKSSGKRRGSRY